MSGTEMADAVVLASLDRHYRVNAGLTTSQFREHQERGSCVSCDLLATAERNPRWAALGRPMLAGAARVVREGGGN